MTTTPIGAPLMQGFADGITAARTEFAEDLRTRIVAAFLMRMAANRIDALCDGTAGSVQLAADLRTWAGKVES